METELQPVVDEQEIELKQAEDLKKNSSLDWDKICAYRTFKIVRIRDRQLGFCYWGIVTCVVLYIVVFGFAIGGKHQEQQPGVGSILTKVYGKAYAGNKVFDPADLRFPVIEPAGAFLLTRKVSVTQTRGTCVDWDQPKPCPCGAGENCKDGYCEVAAWCPSIGDKNAHDPPAEARVQELHGIENIILKISAGISFPGLSENFFVAGATPGSYNQFKNMTVKQLLEKASPPQKLEGKMQSHGALIGVSFFWNCDISMECEPSVVIKRLDSGQGFVQKRADFRRQDGVEIREASYLNGIRLLVDSSGLGRKSSLMLAVIQIGSAIALIRVAGIIADNMMLYSLHYSKDRRDAYYKCKVQETKDYSDLQDRINLIHEAKTRKQHSHGTQHTLLGLGVHGRGGLASAIARGRGSTNV